MKPTSWLYLIVLSGLLWTAGCRYSSEIDVSAEVFIQQLDSIPEAMILDVRSDAEYKSGHLKDARLISIHSPGFSEDILQLDREKTYFVYCLSGSRSRTAVRKMREAGFKRAFNISGGIYQLTSKGIQLVR